jgi:hypothetical protein
MQGRFFCAALAILALALWPSPAWAGQPTLKLSHINFGNQPVGTRLTLSLTGTNRTDRPLRITGMSLSALNPDSGWFQSGDFYGSCRTRGVLAPGESCALKLDIGLPPLSGDHRTLFRASMCVLTELSADNCIIVRGVKKRS